jgi:hypothetical protein
MPSKSIHQPVLYFLLLLLFLLLAACGATLPSQTPLPTPEIISTTPVPASTNSLIPTPSPTLQRVSPTEPLTPSPEITNDSTGGQAIDPTQQVSETETPAFPILCDKVSSERSSPNEKWDVLTCEYDDYSRKMIVENRTGTKWEFKYKDFLDPDAKEPGVAVSSDVYPLHWSPDGHYLYFTSYSGAEGGGTCFYGFGVQGLFRLDLQTGKVSTILALLPPDDWNGYEIAFSPTGRRFSYSRGYAEGGNSFHIIDILSGHETTFPTEQENGTFRWSPDGTSLAYSTSLCNFKAMKVVHSFIKVLTIADLSTRTIAQSDTDFLTIDGWSAETSLLTVESLSYLTNKTRTLSLDSQKSIVISSATTAP